MRVLLIDDDESHNEMMQNLLSQSTQTRYEVVVATTLAAAVQEVAAGDVEVVLLDLNLPDSRGPDTFRKMLSSGHLAPIVVVSGTPTTEEACYSYIIGGAQDYLVKGSFDRVRLERTILYSVARHAFRVVNSELRQMRNSLAEATEKLSAIQEQYTDLVEQVESLNTNITKPVNST